MAYELSSENILTTPLPSGVGLVGISGAPREPNLYGRDSVLAYIQSALAAVASSGSASDLTTGTVPNARLHAYLADISNVQAPNTSDVLYYNGSNWVAGPVTTQGVGVLIATNNLSDLTDASDARDNLGLGTGNDVTHARLGLGGIAPVCRLDINFSTGGAAAAPAFPDSLRIVGADNEAAHIELQSYGNDGSIIQRIARGTAASPLPMVNGSVFGGFTARGWDGTAFTSSSRAKLQFNATENWNSTSHGTEAEIYTTRNGTTTNLRKLKVTNDGILQVGESTAPSTNTLGAPRIQAWYAGPLELNLRNTTNSVEALFGATASAAVIGTATSHAIAFRVANQDLMLFDGTNLYPGSAGTTFLGNASFPWGGATVNILNLPVTTNASPLDGDVWRVDNTNTGLKVRINGVTKTVTVT